MAKPSIGDKTYLELPPPGAENADNKLVQMGTQLVNESVFSRAIYLGDTGSDCVDVSEDESLAIYHYGTSDPHSTGLKFNKCAGTINTFSALSCRTDATMTLKSSSVGEDPVFILKKPYSVPADKDPKTGQPVVDPSTGQPHQPIPLALFQPIDDAIASSVPDVCTVELSAETVIEFYQTIFDFKRRQGRWDVTFKAMIHWKQISHLTMALYLWDTVLKVPVIVRLPAKQWFPDTTVEDVKDMSFVVVDWPIDQMRAKRYFPDGFKLIDKYASRSPDVIAPAPGYSEPFMLLSPARPMVTLRIVLLRNQEVPMTFDESVQAGLVEVSSAPPTPEASEEVSGEMGTENDEGNEEGDEGQGEAGDEDDAGGGGSESGVAATRRIMHVATGNDITASFDEHGKPAAELHENHPYKIANVEWVQIRTETFGHKVSDAWDFPVILDKSTPVPDRPFTVPETVRLRDPQDAINRVNTSMVNHTEWFAGPAGFIDKEAMEQIAPGAKDAHMNPGTIYPIEKELLADGGPFHNVAPPEMSQALPQVADRLDQKFEEVADRPKSLQGIAPTGVTAGNALQALQSAATTSASFKSMYSEEAIYRVGMLAIHDIVWKLEVPDLIKINSRYPAQIVAHFIEYARTKISWDVVAELFTGAAQVKQVNDGQTRADFAAHLIDKKTAREKLGYDAQEIDRREQAEMKQIAEAQAAAVPPQQPPPQKSPMEQINYKDAPEDIKRQMEQQAGLQPSNMGVNTDHAIAAAKIQNEANRTEVDAASKHHQMAMNELAARQQANQQNQPEPAGA